MYDAVRAGALVATVTYSILHVAGFDNAGIYGIVSAAVFLLLTLENRFIREDDS